MTDYYCKFCGNHFNTKEYARHIKLYHKEEQFNENYKNNHVYRSAEEMGRVMGWIE